MKRRILLGSIIAVVILTLASFSSVVSKVTSDEELVEFNVEFTGIGKKYSAQLTQQEAEELELLFDKIRARLDGIESRDDAEAIFKDAVVELDKYGLLGELSIKEAQLLVTKNYMYPEKINLNLINDNSNYLCLITGQTNRTLFVGPLMRFCNAVGLFTLIFMHILSLPVLIGIIANTEYNPLLLFNTITYGAHSTLGPAQVAPSYGWVNTYGLLGERNWNGTLYGHLLRAPIFIYILWLYSGVTGFFGIKICSDLDSLEYFYMGTALCVRIGANPIIP